MSCGCGAVSDSLSVCLALSLPPCAAGCLWHPARGGVAGRVAVRLSCSRLGSVCGTAAGVLHACGAAAVSSSRRDRRRGCFGSLSNFENSSRRSSTQRHYHRLVEVGERFRLHEAMCDFLQRKNPGEACLMALSHPHTNCRYLVHFLIHSNHTSSCFQMDLFSFDQLNF